MYGGGEGVRQDEKRVSGHEVGARALVGILFIIAVLKSIYAFAVFTRESAHDIVSATAADNQNDLLISIKIASSARADSQ